MARLLITGGCGFVGSNLAHQALQKYSVSVIDNLSFGKKENLHSLRHINFIKGDVRNSFFLYNALKGVDFVVHLAALRSVAPSLKNPEKYVSVNVKGTVNVLEACRRNDVKRIVFVSSSSVYGNSKKLPLKESFIPNPLSVYALTKLFGENFCKLYHDLYGIETVVLRYFNVYGPTQDYHKGYASVIPIFINAIINNKRPQLFGRGEQSRDFTFISDAVDANLLAIKTKNATGKVFNISGGQRITINSVLLEINRLLKKDIKPICLPERKGEVKHTLADLSESTRVLGYTPKKSFSEGLEDTVKYFVKRSVASNT